MTDHEFEDLSAYLDGELLPDEAARVTSLLADSEDWQSERDRLERVDGLIHRCEESPPPRVKTWHRAARPEHRPAPSIRLPLLVAVVLMFAIGVLLFVLWSPRPGPPSVAGNSPISPAQPGESPEQTVAPDKPLVEPYDTHETSLPVKLAPETAESKPPETLGLALAGTVLGQSPAAVLRDTTTGTQKVYRVGEEIREGITLKDVSEKEVLVDWNGKETRLTLGALSMEPPPENSLNGVWRAVLVIDDQKENFDHLLEFQQDGHRIEVVDDKGESFATGIIEDNELTLQYAERDNIYVLHGELGTLWDSVVMRFQGATPFDESVDPGKIEIQFTRVPDDERATLAALNEREQEIDLIRGALFRFAQDHDRLFPLTLDLLVPKYLPSVDAFATNEHRRVSYDGHRRQPGINLASAPRFEEFQNYQPYGERLKDYDQLLRKQYGGDAWLNPETILTVEYTDPDVTFTVSTRGDTRQQVHEDVTGQNSSTPDEAELNAWITQDQQNLKQLSILIQMFQNEHQDYTPGGWVSIYPEYMTDPSVLSSPKDPPGTDSYLYLYPGTQLRDLVAERAGDPDIWKDDPEAAQTLASEIPIVLNRTDFPGPEPGRNIVYLDWHVSYVPRDSDEWRKYVRPHLR